MQTEEKEPKVNVKKGHAPRFTCEQHQKSARYALQPDAVRAVLKVGETYTVEEVDIRLLKFRKGVLKC